MADMSVRVYLLGQPHLSVGGQRVHIERYQPRAMLWMLAASPNGLSRGELVRYLWPGVDGAGALRRLSESLTTLTRKIRAGVIRREGERLVMDGVGVDVAVLEATRTRLVEMSTPELEAIADQMRGRPLDGFLVQTQAVDTWLSQLRARVRSLAVPQFTELVWRHVLAEEPEAVLSRARQFVACLPDVELAHRTMVGAALLAGKRELARRYLEHAPTGIRDRLAEVPGLDAWAAAWLHRPQPITDSDPSVMTSEPSNGGTEPVRRYQGLARSATPGVLDDDP